MAVKQFPQSGSEFDDGTTTLVPSEVLVPDGAIDPVTGVVDLTQVGSGNVQIQFKDEGSNLGSLGTVSSVDFVGGGVTASRASNAVTVTVPPSNTQIQFKDQGSNLGSLGTVSSIDFSTGLVASRLSNAVTVIADPTTLGGVGALAFNGQPSNVNLGPFWTVGTEYHSCYYSAWVQPTVANITGYFFSDGSGGAHDLLCGVETDSSEFFYTGNIYDGTQICTQSSIDIIPLGEWVHYEFIYVNGQNIYILLNGICTFVGWSNDGGTYQGAFTGVRVTPGGGSDGSFFVGGSFHNNFPGQVAKMRGVEGDNCGIVSENRFIPRDYNGYITDGTGTTATRADVSIDFSVNGTRSFFDMGEGFDSRIHHGVFSRYDANTLYPTWAAGEIEPSTYVPTPPVTPGGCKVFDSFSRVNNLYLFNESAVLGDTEAGSLGPLTWTTAITGLGFGDGFGVLYGRAVSYPSLTASAWVQTSTSTVDIRVTRVPGPVCSTGILARYKDANNYYKIRGSDTAITLEFMEAGVQTSPTGWTVSAGWSVLRVTMSGTTMSVYTDGALAGTKTVTNIAGATNHGICTGSTVSRFDDFTIF